MAKGQESAHSALAAKRRGDGLQEAISLPSWEIPAAACMVRFDTFKTMSKCCLPRLLNFGPRQVLIFSHGIIKRWGRGIPPNAFGNSSNHECGFVVNKWRIITLMGIKKMMYVMARCYNSISSHYWIIITLWKVP